MQMRRSTSTMCREWLTTSSGPGANQSRGSHPHPASSNQGDNDLAKPVEDLAVMQQPADVAGGPCRCCRMPCRWADPMTFDDHPHASPPHLRCPLPSDTVFLPAHRVGRGLRGHWLAPPLPAFPPSRTRASMHAGPTPRYRCDHGYGPLYFCSSVLQMTSDDHPHASHPHRRPTMASGHAFLPAHRVGRGSEGGLRGGKAWGSWVWTPVFLQFCVTNGF